MDVTVSSPCPEHSESRADGSIQLSKSQKSSTKSHKKKSRASLESSDPKDTQNLESKLEYPRENFDSITQSSIQEGLNTGQGTTVTGDQKRAVSSSAVTGDGNGSESRADGAMQLKKSPKSRTKSHKKKSRASVESSDQKEDVRNRESKVEHPCEKVDSITLCSIQDGLSTGQGTTIIVDQKRAVSSRSVTGDGKGSESRADGSIELSKSQKSRTKVPKKRSRASLESSEQKEDIQNPESKVEHPRENVDSITQLSIQDGSSTGQGTAITVDQKRSVPISDVTGGGKGSESRADSDMQLSKSEKSRTKLHKKKSRVSIESSDQKDTQNPESKVEHPHENVDSITQSSIQDGSSTGQGTSITVDQRSAVSSSAVTGGGKGSESRADGAIQLNISPKSRTKSHKKKSRGSLESSVQKEDVQNPESKVEHPREKVDNITWSSIQDGLSTGQGTTITVDQKRAVSSSAVTGDGKGSENRADGAIELSKSPKSRTKLHKKRSRASLESSVQKEDIQNPDSKVEHPRENVESITHSSLQDGLGTGQGTTTTVDQKSAVSCSAVTGGGEGSESRADGAIQLNKSPKSRKKSRKKRSRASLESSDQKEDIQNPDSKVEHPHENVESITHSTFQDGLGTSQGTTIIVDQKRAVSSSVVTGGGKGSESRADDAIQLNKSPKSRKKSRKKRSRASLESSDQKEDIQNPESKVEHPRENVDSITQSSIQDGLNTSQGTTIIVDQKRAVSSSVLTGGGKGSFSKMEGKKKLEVKSTVQIRKTQRSIKRPTIGEILNPEYIESMKAAIKRRAEQIEKMRLKKLAKGNILNIPENTQGLVIAEKSLSSTNVLEALSTDSQRDDCPKIANGETPSSRTATVDAKTGSREEFMEIFELKREENGKAGNGETGPEMIATRDATSTVSESDGHTKIANGETDLSKTTTIDAETVSKLEIGNANRKLPTKTMNSKKKKGAQGSKTQKEEIGPITPVIASKKPLIIFDVNGFLADIVWPAPKNVEADAYILKRAIFKRPFLDDFLSFCFERFNVGIWSSRTKKVLNPVVDSLLGDLKNKLLFLWDASNCTNSGSRTLEDKHKRLVFKDLRKIWEKDGPNNSWVKGFFDESNTLLFDDTPYKGLLNPKHTGIFPLTYSYTHRNDDFLGPNGALRTYLEGLAASDNMKTYVSQHPFGQDAIDERNRHWFFYSRLLKHQNFCPS